MGVDDVVGAIETIIDSKSGNEDVENIDSTQDGRTAVVTGTMDTGEYGV